jgi:hypothetical protein
LSWNWTNNDLIHNLNTKLVKSILFELIDLSIEDVMADFVNNSQKMFDPVVFVFETDLDFPYEETILPSAEEILLNTIRV